MEHVWADVEGLSLNLVCPTSIVPYAADDGGDVSLCHRDGLSIVQRLDRGKQVSVLLEEVGQLQQVQAPLLGCGVPPYALESLPGGGDRSINIFLGSLVDGADDLLGRRVDDLELLLVGTLNPLIVDEPGERSLMLAKYSETENAEPLLDVNLQANGLLVLARCWRVKLREQRHAGGGLCGRGRVRVDYRCMCSLQ